MDLAIAIELHGATKLHGELEPNFWQEADELSSSFRWLEVEYPDAERRVAPQQQTRRAVPQSQSQQVYERTTPRPLDAPINVSIEAGGLFQFGKLLAEWLKKRVGRRARVKVGDVEIEAATVEDVERLLRLLQETQLGRSDP